VRIINFTVLALLILVPLSVAQETEKPSILVIPPKVTHRLIQEEPEIGQSTADLLRAMLGERYRFPGMAAQIKAAKSTGLSMLALRSDLEGCGRFGRALGADLILTGQFHSFGDRIVVCFQLVEIPAEGPGLLKVATMRQCDGLEGIPGLLPDILKRLGLTVPQSKRVVTARPKPAKVTVEKLIEQLGDDDAGVRFSSAIELGRSGKLVAVEALMKVAVNDRDLFVRRAAARSLGELGNRKAVPALIDLLGDREFFVATTANQAIINITRHDCGFREGLAPEEVKAVTEQARTWWESQED
jgi:hypothetical protein